MTILQSYGYCQATDEMFSLKKRAKAIIPQIYLMGNFFMTLTKILLTMVGLVVCYILMLQSHPQLFDKIPNLVPPLVVKFFLNVGHFHCQFIDCNSFHEYFWTCW